MNKIYEDSRIGGEVYYRLLEDGEKLMRVPNQVKDCVVFVGYLQTGYEDRDPIVDGTAFLLSYPYENLIKGERKQHLYIVTAKHVLDGIVGNSKKPIIYLRFNFKDKPAQWIPIERDKWESHPDTDLAILPVNPFDDEYEFDHNRVPGSMIVDDYIVENEKIGIGDEIVVAGLFLHHPGTERNIPTVRSGIIATMPEEPVWCWWIKKNIDAYLIEVHSVGGFSGSPVFVYLGGRSIPMPMTKESFRIYERLTHFPKRTYFLLGVNIGHWTIKESEVGYPINRLTNEEKINRGIAMVVPANKIKDILNKPKIKKMREKREREELNKSSFLV